MFRRAKRKEFRDHKPQLKHGSATITPIAGQPTDVRIPYYKAPEPPARLTMREVAWTLIDWYDKFSPTKYEVEKMKLLVEQNMDKPLQRDMVRDTIANLVTAELTTLNAWYS